MRHLIYLVEEYGDAQHFRLPKSSLQQAITNTQVLYSVPHCITVVMKYHKCRHCVTSLLCIKNSRKRVSSIPGGILCQPELMIIVCRCFKKYGFQDTITCIIKQNFACCLSRPQFHNSIHIKWFSLCLVPVLVR